MGTKWTAADIPDQTGRVAVVTGANSGLGLVTARELARAGATVVMACRDPKRGEEALATVREAAPKADVVLRQLDLASLASVRKFAESLDYDKIDVLVNNAGIMAPPRRETEDGFEAQFGTNHLGHYALTGRLFEKLTDRVVTVSSGLHRIGRIDFDDLQSTHRYRKWGAYGQSKLANLLFAFELDRRSAALSAPVRSYAAHPGYAATNLQATTAKAAGGGILEWGIELANRILAQPMDMGALPSLYAATYQDLPGGSFVGPDRLFEQRGNPKIVHAVKAAYDEDAARRLWEISAKLTGVTFP